MKTHLKLFFRFLRFIFPYRKKFVGIFILSIVAMFLNLLNPYISKLVVDKGIVNKDLKVFIFLIAVTAIILILGGILEGFKDFLARYINARIKFDLNRKLFIHLQKISLIDLQDKSTGEYLYKIGYDIERTADFITLVPHQAVAIFPKILFTLLIIFYLNWQIAIFSIMLVPFLYLPNLYLTRHIRRLWRELFENYEKIFSYMQEIFSHFFLIKAFGRESQDSKRYLRMLLTNTRIIMRNSRWEILRRFSTNTISHLLVSLITFYGGYQVIVGKMSLGSLTAIMIYLTQLMFLQNQYTNLFHLTATGLVSCQRLADIFDKEKLIIENQLTQNIKFYKGEIIFKGISFGYSPDKLLFKQIDFLIKGGSHIGLVGPSGCGKTTLVNLILRLLVPLKGEIIIDGYNINCIKSDAFYEQIGVVLQESYLWNDTIENNICYGRQKATFEEIKEAAQLACIDAFINTLPQGYKTVIGENACKLSEGQKQRIAIARAVIKKPKILILDEAFSSLDAQTEDKIMDNLKVCFKESTLIIISHQLSTLEKLDAIYFLKSPQSITVGRPHELLKENLFLSLVNEA